MQRQLEPSPNYRCSGPPIPAIRLAVALVPLLALLLLSPLLLWPVSRPAIAIGVVRALLWPAAWPAIAIGVALALAALAPLLALLPGPPAMPPLARPVLPAMLLLPALVLQPVRVLRLVLLGRLLPPLPRWLVPSLLAPLPLCIRIKLQQTEALEPPLRL